MGEVGGAMPEPEMLGSDDDTLWCHACVNKKAVAYCPNCEVYLCQACVDYHRKLPTLENHRLLCGSKMPLFDPAKQNTGTEEGIETIAVIHV